MHSNDIAHATPQGPRGDFAPRGLVHSSPPSATENRHHGSEHSNTNAHSRGRDFVGNVLYAHVMTALKVDYRIASAVPVQGLTPSESAVQGLAGAARQALSPGGQGADSLRQSVGSGLQDAASLLQILGAAVEDVAALAENVRSQLESFIGSIGSALVGSTAQESVVGAGARFTQQQKTHLEIVTQEGDTVRLSLHSKLDVSAGGVASTTQDGTTSQTTATVISGSKFKISVDGDLNDDEIAAIQNVLTKVEALAEDFFQGDVEAAFAAAANLNMDTDQLASVALDLKMKQRIRVVGFASQPTAALPPAAPSVRTAPQPGQSTPLPALGTVPSEPQAHTDVAPANPQQSDAVSSPETTIFGYLMHVLDSLLDAGNAGQASVSLKFKLELLYAATSAHADSQIAQAEPSAVDESGDTPSAVDNTAEAASAVDKLGEALSALT